MVVTVMSVIYHGGGSDVNDNVMIVVVIMTITIMMGVTIIVDGDSSTINRCGDGGFRGDNDRDDINNTVVVGVTLATMMIVMVMN